MHQHVAHGVLKGAADVVAHGIGQAAAVRGAGFFNGGEHGGFESGKTHLQIVRVQHRARKGKGVGRAQPRQLGEFGAAWVGQAEQFGGFVEGFAGGVVHAFAQQGVVADAAHRHKLGVSAGNQQGNERKLGALVGQQRREQVAFEMVHRQHGLAKGKGQRAGVGGAGKQGAAQAGALGVGNGVDVGVSNSGFGQAGPGERHQPADVVAAGQFGHHAAVFGVHGHLGVQRVADQAAFAAVKGDAGFVAGGFDAED